MVYYVFTDKAAIVIPVILVLLMLIDIAALLIWMYRS